jgi:multicomponent Na+:H+ antiporter subunit E
VRTAVHRVTSRWGLLLWLAAVWVGLWGSVTPANVLGGLGIGALLLAVLPLTDVESTGIVRPAALARFVGYFLVDLVRSSVQVVVLVLRPTVQLRQAVIAVPVLGASDNLLTLLANAISLTPGTLTLEVDRPRSTLYVHVIDVGTGPDGVEAVRADLRHVERLAVLAVGSPACRAELERRP